jgi:hypothetical protein
VSVVFELPFWYWQEHLYWARNHLKEREVRAAVLEAFTALDDFIWRWASAALRSLGTPEKIVEYLTEREQSSRLIQMVKKLFPGNGFEKPDDELFRLRQRVLHRTSIPAFVDVENAIDTIERWIEETRKKAESKFVIPPDHSA